MSRRSRVKIKKRTPEEMAAIHRQTGCENKKVFLSESDAAFAISNIKRFESTPMTFYQCAFCRWWHLTRK